jgi:hypothetical protein
MKACWGSGSMAACIFYLGTRWRWVFSFTPRPLYPQGKSPWYPLDRRLGVSQRRSGRGHELFFATTSRPVLGPTQPPIQWIVGVARAWKWSFIFSSALVTNELIYTATYPRCFIRVCLFKDRNKFIFPLSYHPVRSFIMGGGVNRKELAMKRPWPVWS